MFRCSENTARPCSALIVFGVSPPSAERGSAGTVEKTTPAIRVIDIITRRSLHPMGFGLPETVEDLPPSPRLPTHSPVTSIPFCIPLASASPLSRCPFSPLAAVVFLLFLPALVPPSARPIIASVLANFHFYFYLSAVPSARLSFPSLRPAALSLGWESPSLLLSLGNSYLCTIVTCIVIIFTIDHRNS